MSAVGSRFAMLARRTVTVVLATLALTTASTAADDVPLVTDLSNHLVAITTGFTGTTVLLFGATDGPGDIAVVVRGPAKDIAVRRKQRFGPIWVNARTVTLHDMPSFYRMASSRPVAEFASDQLLSRYQIGFAHLRMDVPDTKVAPADVDDFRRALLRLESANGLYSEESDAVSQMSNRLFRNELFFPADVPTGTYLVEVYLFRNGAVASAEIVPFTVSKIGIDADIYDFAQHYGLIYGLLALIMAMAAGYGAAAAFQRA
jgi:uncharacterized protein (TIGR02186 family)